MQEDMERRALAISVTAGRLTARVLARAFSAVRRQILWAQRQVKERAKSPQGRQSAKEFLNENPDAKKIPLDGSTRLFDRVARKFGVDYTFRKTGPRKYMLFFKAEQVDQITECFAEYTKRAMQKERRLPIREQMRKAADITRSKPRERVREREAARDDR